MKRLCLLLAIVCISASLTACTPSPASAEDTSPTAESTEPVTAGLPSSPYGTTIYITADLPDHAVLLEPIQPEVAATSMWKAHCQQFINLRTKPDGRQVIATILKGETVQVLSWEEKHAKVLFKGLVGYVLAANLVPAEENFPENCLDTVQLSHMYSHSRLLADLTALRLQYPDAVTVETLGASTQGRAIPVLRIGDPNAEHHILLQGAIHGREYATAWLLMAMADYWLDRGYYIYSNVCIHIIPMVNPDGVTISQSGTLNDLQQEIYLSDLDNDYTILLPGIYSARWKANAQGVDINRNFPSGWSEADDRDVPSSQNYRGSEPFSTPEAIILRDYTLRYDFDATLSYHASGSVIYWAYGDKALVNAQSFSLALAVEGVTGYTPKKNTLAVGAGYKDWAMDALEIPSLTVEIGYGDAPLGPSELSSIFARNYQVLPTVVQWVQQHAS